jgi:platelet-activating factor acetylhydrolase IB subunit alpha
VIKTLQGHEHEVSSVEFIPGGDFLFSSSNDQTVKMWDINSGFCVQTLKSHSDFVKKVTVNLKGTLLASSSKDQSIIIWNMS